MKFQKEVCPTGIRIYETYNPGAVVRIWAMGDRGWVKLWEGEPESVGHTSRLFKPPIKKVNFLTRKLKLEFNQVHLNDYTQLDAVLLEGNTKLHGQEDRNKNRNNLQDYRIIQMNTSKIDNLTDLIISLGFHNMLRTEWDLCQDLALDSMIMGDFYSLPDETILKIFNYLDLQSLCRCAQVNKTFNRLSQDPILFKSINLKPYWHSVDEPVLYNIAKKAVLLQKIDLSWCGCDIVPSYNCFSMLVRNSSSTLTHLRLNSCRFVDNYMLSSITESCLQLRELSLNSCRNIKPCDFILLSRLKNLVRLELYRTRIEAPALLIIISRNKKLQHLNLGACVYLSSMDDVARELGSNCPDLISIDLWKNYSLTPIGIRSLTKCVRLQEVDFGWCLQAGSSGEWIGELVQSCPDMKKFFIGALRAISDRDLRPLIKFSPKLEQLDLFGSAISPDICEALLLKCDKLKLLDVNFCEQISEVQVKLWRQTYPNVIIKRSQVR